jgi:protein involved in polysaccharide export with SLBB domain
LQFLSLSEREHFLKALGEDARWYPADLQTKVIDRNLKQFGYKFFTNTVGGFEPERLAPVGPDYVVGPGDTLVVSLWGSVDGTHEITVDRSGNVFLPRVGAIQVWGLTFAEVRETLRKQIAPECSDTGAGSRCPRHSLPWAPANGWSCRARC